MAYILIADDDTSLADTVRNWLFIDKHKVDVAADGDEAWDLLRTYEYDMLILDWDMPRRSGIEILKDLRAKQRMIPVLILTGKNQIEDKEMALDEGADDYVTKPFHLRELSARLRALMRRPAVLAEERLSVRSVTLDPKLRKVEKDGKEVSIQPLEFDLLEFFLRHPNTVFPIDRLIQSVWGTDADVSLEAVYSCIKRMRRKLDTPGERSIVRTVSGSGYCLES